MDYHIYIAVGVIVFLDILTGLAKAVSSGTLSSSKMRTGMWHKISYVLAICFAAAVNYACQYLDLGIDLSGMELAVCVYIVVTDCISVCENLVAVNPDLCELFSRFFEREEGK